MHAATHKDVLTEEAFMESAVPEKDSKITLGSL